jgi:hypothetical protein
MRRSILSLHYNISSENMNKEKMEYAKFGKVGLKSHVNLLHSNVLQRAHQWPGFV